MTIKNNANFTMERPTQCHLWKQEELLSYDTYQSLVVVETFLEESHLSRRLVKCTDCGQLYFKEFYEEVDWINGEDPQYITLVPVETQEQIDLLKQSDIFSINLFAPRIHSDFASGDNKPKVYWVGRT